MPSKEMDDHGYDHRVSNHSTVNLGGSQLCDPVVTKKRSYVPPTSCVEPTSSAGSGDGLKYSRRPKYKPESRNLDNVDVFAVSTLGASKAKKLCLGVGGSAATSTSNSSLVPTEDVVEKPMSEILVHLENNDAERQEQNLDSACSEQFIDLDYVDHYISYDVDEEEFYRRLDDESELPAWYNESHLCNLLPSSLLDADDGKDLTSLQAEQLQAASAHQQVNDDGTGGSGVLPSDHESGREASLSTILDLGDDIILPSIATPILGVDLDKALTLAADDAENAEAFTQAVIRLYNYTAASMARGSFLPAVANNPQTVDVPGERPEGKADRKGSTSLLVPKEETGDSGPQGYLPRPITKAVPVKQQIVPVLAKVKQEIIDEVKEDMVAVKHEEAAWNMASPGAGQDVVSYESAQELLQRLGEVWFERYKEAADDDGKDSTSGARTNPDLIRLRVARALRHDGLWLNYNERPIGHCPGIPIGACFTYRIEMVLTGLHNAYQNGIAVIPAGLSPYKEPVSPSVVLLAGGLDKYKDDRDMGDEVVYCGHGGYCPRTKTYRDQVLERGNLALANSLEFEVPVRLIRGRRDQRSRTGRLYSYDGLYKVIALNFTVGVKGNKVFLFTMVRLPGQGPLPVPSKDALLLRPQDQNESYYQRPSEASRKLGTRTPLLENKKSTSAAVSKVPSRSPSVRRKSTTAAVSKGPAMSVSASRSRSCSDSGVSVKLCSSSKKTTDSASADSVSSMAVVKYTPPFTRSQARKCG